METKKVMKIRFVNYLINMILEGEGLNGGSFTKEELMELLSGK